MDDPASLDTGLLRSLFQNSDDAMLYFDAEDRLAGRNRAAELIAGHGWQSGISRRDVLLMAVERGAERHFTAPDGHVYLCIERAITGDDASTFGTLLILRDISHYRELQRNQSEFVQIVSHDLRSPLTTLRGYAEMLEEQVAGPLNDQQQLFLGRILSGLYQLSSLVDNIQDAGRFDPLTGFYELLIEPVDANDLIRSIVTGFLLPNDKHALMLIQELNADLPVIFADGALLERALHNLIDNAVKYSPDGSTVVIRSAQMPGGIRLSVTDQGIGISAEEQTRLFQRHVRISNEQTRKIKGSGLGLFIVKSAALRHGGQVQVRSAAGEGSTFTLMLPLDARPNAPVNMLAGASR